MDQNLTDEQIAEAARLTQDELDYINSVTFSLFDHEQRPIVLMALCSSIIGNLVTHSEGQLNKELIVDLVDKGVEVL